MMTRNLTVAATLLIASTASAGSIPVASVSVDPVVSTQVLSVLSLVIPDPAVAGALSTVTPGTPEATALVAQALSSLTIPTDLSPSAAAQAVSILSGTLSSFAPEQQDLIRTVIAQLSSIAGTP